MRVNWCLGWVSWFDWQTTWQEEHIEKKHRGVLGCFILFVQLQPCADGSMPLCLGVDENP